MEESDMNDSALKAEAARRGGENNLGRLLLDHGKIKQPDIERILQYAKRKGLRFGEAAIKLKVVSRADVEYALATQFEYPYLLKGEGGFSKELVAAYKPFTPKVEAMRALRGQLMVRWFNDEHNCLAIVNPDSGTGRSYLVANLAVVFSQLGDRTLLVDADMQNARQHKIFGLDNSTGLSAALVGRNYGDLPIQDILLFKNLSVMTAGAPPPNPSELLGRSHFSQIQEQLAKSYDIVLFDTPPGNSSTATEAVAGVCGGALMILTRNHTRISEAKTFVDRLQTHVNIVGTVLSRT